MTTTIEIDDDTDIDTLTTLLEAKTGEDIDADEAISRAVAYWLDSHEVTECDDSSYPSLPARPRRGPDIRIDDTEIGVDASELIEPADVEIGRTVPDNDTGRHDFEC